MHKITNKALDLFESIISKIPANEGVLRIEETSKSPFVFMAPESGIIILRGYVFLQRDGEPGVPSSDDFIRPLIRFLENFNKIQSIEGHFMLPFFTSSFSKALKDLFINLRYLYKRKINVTCYWYYESEDEDSLGSGEDYESSTGLPFVMIEI